jgi:hypothetical protein
MEIPIAIPSHDSRLISLSVHKGYGKYLIHVLVCCSGSGTDSSAPWSLCSAPASALRNQVEIQVVSCLRTLHFAQVDRMGDGDPVGRDCVQGHLQSISQMLDEVIHTDWIGGFCQRNSGPPVRM